MFGDRVLVVSATNSWIWHHVDRSFVPKLTEEKSSGELNLTWPRITIGAVLVRLCLQQPIVTKLDPLTNLTWHSLYLPKFEEETGAANGFESATDHPVATTSVAWVERSSGRCFKGGENYSHPSFSDSSRASFSPATSIGYRLSETAEFIRPGSVIPMVPTPSARWNGNYANTSTVCPTLSATAKTKTEPQPAALLGAASRVPCTLEWHIYIGNASFGSGELLEDDGRSTAYLSGEDAIARTVANYTLDDATMLVKIGPQAGQYVGRPSARWVSVVVHNVFAPISAKVLFPRTSGRELMDGVSWDAKALTATVQLGIVDEAQGTSFELSWSSSPICELLCRSGRTGWIRLNQRVLDIKREIDWEASRPIQAGAHCTKHCTRLELLIAADTRRIIVTVDMQHLQCCSTPWQAQALACKRHRKQLRASSQALTSDSLKL